VLTGDTLFIGDVGRPDLMASVGVSAQDLAGQLYRSVHRLLQLPDETLVYPGHGAGSACGKNLSSETVSTIGAQRRDNGSLQPMSQEAFVTLVTTDQPKAPQHFGYDAQLNRRRAFDPEAALPASWPRPARCGAKKAPSGTGQISDARAGRLCGGAPAGSTNVSPRRFASWAGRCSPRPGPSSSWPRPKRARGGCAAWAHRLRQRSAISTGHRRGAGRPTSSGASSAHQRELASGWVAGRSPWSMSAFGERRARSRRGEHPPDQLDERLAEIRGQAGGRLLPVGLRSATAASPLEQAGFGDVVDLPARPGAEKRPPRRPPVDRVRSRRRISRPTSATQRSAP
jgi:hypothetical protein